MSLNTTAVRIKVTLKGVSLPQGRETGGDASPYRARHPAP